MAALLPRSQGPAQVTYIQVQVRETHIRNLSDFDQVHVPSCRYSLGRTPHDASTQLRCSQNQRWEGPWALFVPQALTSRKWSWAAIDWSLYRVAFFRTGSVSEKNLS